MAITATGTNGTNREVGSDTTIAASAFVCTTGNAIVVGVSNYNTGQTVSSIADTAGNTYVRLGNVESPDSSGRMEMWLATNITGHAANVVTVTFDAGTTFRTIAAAEFTQIATASPLDQSTTVNISGTGTTHTTDATGTTVQADELIIAFYITWLTAQVYSGTGGNTIFAQHDTGYNALAGRVVSATGAYDVSLTTGVGTQAAMMVRTLKAAASNSVVPVVQRQFRARRG